MIDKKATTSAVEAAKELWSQGDHMGALKVLRENYRNNPDNVSIAYEYGHLLGSLSSGQPSEEKAVWRGESIQVLSRACDHLEGLDPLEQWKIRRHYFLYAGQHLQNRDLGYKEIARGNSLGILSVGFGSLHHAIDLANLNNLEEAHLFAKEAKDAFEKLLAIDTPRYGRWLSYALALALLGQEKEAVAATIEAAELMGKRADELVEHNAEMKRLLKKETRNIKP